MQFPYVFKFLLNIFNTMTIYHSLFKSKQFYSSAWICEHIIDTLYSVLYSGISSDQISIVKPGFPRVTYAPLERQTCIVERKAGDRNSSCEILLQACASVCECMECLYARNRNRWMYFKKGTVSVFEFGSRWCFLLQRKDYSVTDTRLRLLMS